MTDLLTSEVVAQIRSTQWLGEGIGGQRFLTPVALLCDSHEALREQADRQQRRLQDICEVCWTTSWEPTPEGRRCGQCALIVACEDLRSVIGTLLGVIDDLARSLRDFGADQQERRAAMYRKAAQALDAADAVRKLLVVQQVLEAAKETP